MSTYLAAVIRHGAYQQKSDTPSALQPFPLTEAGAQEVRLQAREFAQTLEKNNWQLHPEVHSSPLLRAWQTAQIYMEELAEFFVQPPVHLQFAELCERSVGNVANLTIAEIEQILTQDPRFTAPPDNWKSDSHYQLPFLGAESLMQAGARVAAHLNASAHKNSTLNTNDIVQLLIGHGAAIRHAACHLNVMELCEVSKFSMFHAHPVVLSFDGQHWQHIAGKFKRRTTGNPQKQGDEALD